MLASASTWAVTESLFLGMNFVAISTWRSVPTASTDLLTNSSSAIPSAFNFWYCCISLLIDVSVGLVKLIAANPCPCE